MQEVNQIHSFLIGLCCAKDGLRQQIHDNWEKRFSPHTSFLVDVDDGDEIRSIVLKAQAKLMEQRVTVPAGKSCVLAIFCDLTTQVNSAQLDVLDRSISMLSQALKCYMSTTIQFAYVGQVSLLEERAAVRNHISAMVDRNIKQPLRTQLLLVATPFLQTEGYELWKPSMLLLDLLRRNSNPPMLLPETPDGQENNDIGFLSYAEHDSVLREKLSAEVKELTRLVNPEGSERLSKAKQELLQRKKKDILADYPTNGGLQPQHPDMNVPDKGFFNKRKQAAKGKLDSFNIAMSQTLNAVLATANALYEEIMEVYKAAANHADALLEQLQKESGTGIPVLQDERKMLELLSYSDTAVRRPSSPNLFYSEKGYIFEIESFLSLYREYAIYSGAQILCEALCGAYKKKPLHTYEEQLDRLRHDLSEKTLRLDTTCEPEVFFENAYYGSQNLMAEFFAPPSGSIDRTYVTVRGSKFRYLESKEQGYAGNTSSFYFSETGSGITQPDNAPIKALRLTLLDCTSENLLSLIPEV